MLDRRQAWPAVLLMGVGMLTLALILKSSQGDVLLQPHWLMAIPGVLYIGLGLALGGLSWRWPTITLSMGLLHLLSALLMGWGYSALEGAARRPCEALVHGLWEYAPGTALQAGWACFATVVLSGWLYPKPAESDSTDELVAELTAAPAALPSLPRHCSPSTLCQRAATVPEVAGVLITGEGSAAGGGIWEGDPLAALQRVRALRQQCGDGLQTIPLGETVLMWRCEGARLIALLAGSQVSVEVLSGLLRKLWEATANSPDQA